MSAAALILFWPESVKIERKSKKPSILKQFSAQSVFKLFQVAYRKSRNDRADNSKEAIKKIVRIQLLKITMLSVSSLFSISFFVLHGILEYEWFILVLLTPLPDWLLWDVKLERELQIELLERRSEFGSINFQSLDPTAQEISARGEIQNSSESHEWVEINMGDQDELFGRVERIAKHGQKHYERLQPDLEREHWGKCVCINTETGEYVLGDTISDVHAKFDARFGQNVPAYNAKVGIPTHVGFAEWAL